MSKTRRPSKTKSDFDLLNTFWREPVARTVLPNGLTVLVKPDHSAPVASVQVWVRTGSIHEGENLGAGLSHYLEHMLFKGTKRRAAREISATVQAHGGLINAYTTFDRTVYHIDLPSEHTALAIDVLADMMLHSSIDADETAREKDVILREIDMCRDDPDTRLGESLFDTAFRRHPYRYPVIGYRDVFSTVTREELVAYYRARYVANNMVVVVTGDVDGAGVLAEVEKHFADAPRARLAPVLVEDEPAQLAPREAHFYEDVEITRAGLAWQAPGIAHPDAPLLDLLATILGAGDSSILWQAIREKARLVHAIDAQSWTPGGAGLFSISFICDPEKRDPAIRAINESLARCASKGFTAAQIKKVIRQLVVGEINSRKTMSGQAARLGASEVIVGDLGYARAYFERLRKVTPADLKRVLKAYLVPERLTTVSLSPKGEAKKADLAVRATAAFAPEFEEIKMPNGARLLLQRDAHLPSLHVRLLCQGGPLFEAPGKRGATALLGTMLARDTRRRTAAEVAQAIEEIGGVLYPFSGNNSIGLGVEVLSDGADVERGLELLADAVFAPAFKRGTFETEREALLAALAQDEDDVVSHGRKLVRKKFFGAYPLACDASGDAEGVRALAPSDLAALWKRLFVSQNVVLAVAGDFEKETLLPKLKAFLKRVPKGGLAAEDHAGGMPAFPGDFTDTQPREQAVVYQAFPGPGLLADDFYAGEVMDEFFSGMSSRLFERVREEKGLAYFVRSSRVTGLRAGMFLFFAGTSPAHYEEVLREIDAEIARVQSGKIGEDEVERCRVRLKAGRRMSLQTNASRAMQAGLNALYGQPVNDWLNYDKRIDAVGAKDLRDFARLHFKRALRTQLVVKP
ncbi:zinc protease [Ereboglobus sp. PH5-5]|uniref:M16 family metallopeptidase n=1 Tax=Ereboglobus sp. PH5-5 TaxID=2940529 RepID=UPI002405542D|nr:pitrilysin family protein [Ereboglobus sp. PH5-5]MDF9831887.1 zinc protease [Ereboglobus sp. PH5-5]